MLSPGDQTMSAVNSSNAFDPSPILAKYGQRRAYKRKQQIFDFGDPADYIYFVIDGRIRITKMGPNSKDKTVCLVKDQPFGLEMLIGMKKMLISASAFSDCVIQILDWENVERLVKDDPMTLAKLLAGRVADLMDRLGDQLLWTGRGMLAKCFLELADEDGRIPETPQNDLGDCVGRSRQMVIEFMKEFKGMGLMAGKAPRVRINVAKMRKLIEEDWN
jgi:CRP-like cAMP-binding protein